MDDDDVAVVLSMGADQAIAVATALGLLVRLSRGDLGAVARMVSSDAIPSQSERPQSMAGSLDDALRRATSASGGAGGGERRRGRRAVNLVADRCAELDRILRQALALQVSPPAGAKWSPADRAGLKRRLTQDVLPTVLVCRQRPACVA